MTYCEDCNAFVSKDHRCQQWQTTYHLNTEAVKKLIDPLKQEIQALKEESERLKKYAEKCEDLMEAMVENDDPWEVYYKGCDFIIEKEHKE